MRAELGIKGRIFLLAVRLTAATRACPQPAIAPSLGEAHAPFTRDGYTQVPLTLHPAEGYFIVFRRDASAQNGLTR